MSTLTTVDPAKGNSRSAENARTATGITATDAALLVLRIALGVIFFAHGAQKMLGWFGGNGLAATVQGMSQGGIPVPLVYVAVFTEFFGGLAVIVGALTRLASLGLFVTMLVAIFKVHLANGFFMNGAGGAGIEYNVALAAMSLALVLAGPGRIALGDWEPRFLRRGRSGSNR